MVPKRQPDEAASSRSKRSLGSMSVIARVLKERPGQREDISQRRLAHRFSPDGRGTLQTQLAHRSPSRRNSRIFIRAPASRSKAAFVVAIHAVVAIAIVVLTVAIFSIVAIVVVFVRFVAMAKRFGFPAALATVAVIDLFEVISTAAAGPIFVSAGRHDSVSGVGWWVTLEGHQSASGGDGLPIQQPVDVETQVENHRIGIQGLDGPVKVMEVPLARIRITGASDFLCENRRQFHVIEPSGNPIVVNA